MDRPHRDSRQYNGITLADSAQPTFATQSTHGGSHRLDQKIPSKLAELVFPAFNFGD
jgi:hypothetical protein